LIVRQLRAVEVALRQLALDVQSVGIPLTFTDGVEQPDERIPKVFSDVILEDRF